MCTVAEQEGAYKFFCVECGLLTQVTAPNIDEAKKKFRRLHDDYNELHKDPYCDATNYRVHCPDGRSMEC
jgi:transcription elongation factor Elf1